MKIKRALVFFAAAFAALVALTALALLVVNATSIGRDIEPPDFSDLDLPAVEPVPPEENALTHLARARDAFVTQNADGQSLSHHVICENPDLIAEALAANAETFQHLERAAQCARCVYPAWKTPDDYVFQLQNFASMAWLMPFKIKRELENGDTETALRDIETLLRCGQLMRQNPTTLVETLVAGTFERIGLDEAQKFAKNLNVSEAQLRRLQEHLENTPSYTAAMLRARKAEFQWTRMFPYGDMDPFHYFHLPRRPNLLFQHLF